MQELTQSEIDDVNGASWVGDAAVLMTPVSAPVAAAVIGVAIGVAVVAAMSR